MEGHAGETLERKVNKRGQVRPTTYRSKFRRSEIFRSNKTEEENPTDEELDDNVYTFSDSTNQNCTPECTEDNVHIESSDNNVSICEIIEAFIHKPKVEDVVSMENDDFFKDMFNFENYFRDDDEDFEESINEDFKEKDLENDWEHENIYPGHFLPVKLSVLLVWLYAINHSITGTQLQDLLTLIGFHCILPHPALRSLYMFKKYFANTKSQVIKHFYCNFCMTSVNEEVNGCTNPTCLKDLRKKGNKLHFLEIPVEDQIKNLFKRDYFPALLKKRFSRVKKNESNIEDVYDSSVYKLLSQKDGPLSEKFPFNLSFTMNTDGVPVFKSSKMSIWPIYMMINELPYKYRMKQENMILCGLWFGDTKPFMPRFTEPLYKSLMRMEKGIEVSVNDKIEICCCYLLCLTADLPAKSSILNWNQFNGQYSCIKCKQSGQNFRTQKGGNILVFPYHADSPTEPKRTKQMCIDDAILACNSNKTVNGVKGPSFFMALQSFQFVQAVSVDYMHCILQGITKLLIDLWFGSSHASEVFSLHTHVDIIDERLSKIKPPLTISRMPRSVSQHFKYWKASELRNWLFYYSIPLLNDVMSSVYLYHYSALVEAVYLLSSDSISHKDLEMANKLFCFFVYMFESLYGSRYYTLNLHSLLHLSQCVYELGPLWAHSCFPFENANGDLLKLFHGTQHVDIQIVNAVNVYQNLPCLSTEVDKSSQVYKFVCKMQNKEFKESEDVNSYHFLGKPYEKELFGPEVYKALVDHIGCRVDHLLIYRRLSLCGQLYHSIDYERVQVRNSFTVKYIANNKAKYGFVWWYGVHQHAQSSHINPLCCIKKLNITNLKQFGLQSSLSPIDNFLGITLKHFHTASESSDIEIIHVENILSLCVCLKVDNTVYICEEPNRKEINL